jgi:amidohydrolase
MKTLQDSIATLTPRLIETRHHLHQHPELSNGEAATAHFVAERLAALGLDVQTGVGGHGVVGTLRGNQPGRTLALRADMDALPIAEASSSLPYRSQNDGVMHACGHDGHTTVLLGTAEVLAAQREQMAGEVRFLFQPAEELGSGALRMIADGALEGVDAIAALHGWPPLPVGQIGIRHSAMTASADTFEIVIRGHGAHAAYPHLSVDPIVTAAQVILALQTVVSRETEPTAPAVVSITQVNAGTAANVIPETVRLVGTIRAHSHEVRAALPEQIQRVCEGICAAFRCTCTFTLSDGSPAVINDSAIATLLADAAADVLGSDNVLTLPNASMGAEDFSEYLAHVPGAMFRLGLGNPTPLHAPTFNFTDEAIPVGVRVLTAFAVKYLGQE